MIGGKWKRASCTLPTSGAGLVCRSSVVQGGLRCYYSGTRRIIGVRRLRRPLQPAPALSNVSVQASPLLILNEKHYQGHLPHSSKTGGGVDSTPEWR